MSGRSRPLSLAADGAPPVGRRAFLDRACAGLGLIAAGELAWVVGRYLAASPAEPDAATGVVEAGPVDAFPPGTVAPFPQGRFYLVRLGSGGFLALSSRCTHLGCTVGLDSARGTFPCPCHGSTFDLRGEVNGPPARRPLDLHAVAIDGGVVRVDTRRALRRDAFDPAQAVSP